MLSHNISNALIEAREERLKLEASIPIKLQDGWKPTIRIRVNDFDCNALCDLGASSSMKGHTMSPRGGVNRRLKLFRFKAC